MEADNVGVVLVNDELLLLFGTLTTVHVRIILGFHLLNK